MKTITRTCLLFLALNAALGMSAPAAAAISPEGVVKAFYTARIELGFRGLPDANAMARIAPLMTKGLISSIERATREQESFIKQHSDEKPPWIEGDLFSSLFEGPTSFDVGIGTTTGDRASVPVHFTYVEGNDREHALEWTDRVIVVMKAGIWRVDEVEYGGEWDFALKGKLSAVLK